MGGSRSVDSKVWLKSEISTTSGERFDAFPSVMSNNDDKIWKNIVKFNCTK